ncbi:thioredoxin-like protein [Talaromyces proteolyticus]|uniref:Thioredoxin-like protein n=1 Tax=Talaromyces proteolyticus TaxID=1131652 RepID=A0AAD4KQZ8_9EURO|nr:thioredoxin-like protein [Talaromyces proteolyticus]KAH8698510.1 thioredoxin-like protein [Talaromyces proteolyticus]
MASIKLYTNRNCPWAHRAHIALAELGLPFEEVIIDYSKPRTPEYLKINPRGMVPTMTYGDHIVFESAIIAQFLADSVASTHLIPRTGEVPGALMRQRIAYFVETYFSKANVYYYRAIEAKTDEDAEELGKRYVDAVVKEVEPLLQDADPFFGGSDKLTMAEVLTASFILRIFTLPDTENAPLPKTMVAGLDEKAPKFYAWAQVTMKHPSVNGIYNRDGCAAEMRDRRAKARALA